MAFAKGRGAVQSIGIDLGTTYSSLAYLTPQGAPVTLPNAEGELSTPSVVLFDGDEAIVGAEALRHSIASPERVIVHPKRHMGDPRKVWHVDGRFYRPKDVSALILRKLLNSAEERLGPVKHAVITVPAQFSELQRRDTVEAGLQAGLERIDLINEPVAAAMCYVLGEGMWFAELANDQTVMVFDLGGGTFDLSLVRYNAQEVQVIASGGDLRLGGLDWNHALQEYACDEYIKESIADPRLDRESMQLLALEVEQVKRSLSVRPRSSLVVQHEGRRRTFPMDRSTFEALTRSLLDRTEALTRKILKDHKLGWANVDAVLITGGSSRMPMIRNMLQRISGTTRNQTLSPDQSICYGAAYYAGSLNSGRRIEQTVLNAGAVRRLSSFRQRSVSGRGLGILVRDLETGKRQPQYLIRANTPLPCAFRQQFGTAVENQTKVHLYIVESGAGENDPPVELGECVIEGLPEHLPLGSPVDVTIRYDEQARVHVEAVDLSSGARALTTIIRQPPPAGDEPPDSDQDRPIGAPAPSAKDTLTMLSPSPSEKRNAGLLAASPANAVQKQGARVAKRAASVISLDDADRPIPLCNRCGNALDHKGRCLNRRCPPPVRRRSAGHG